MIATSPGPLFAKTANLDQTRLLVGTNQQKQRLLGNEAGLNIFYPASLDSARLLLGSTPETPVDNEAGKHLFTALPKTDHASLDLCRNYSLLCQKPGSVLGKAVNEGLWIHLR